MGVIKTIYWRLRHPFDAEKRNIRLKLRRGHSPRGCLNESCRTSACHSWWLHALSDVREYDHDDLEAHVIDTIRDHVIAIRESQAAERYLQDVAYWQRGADLLYDVPTPDALANIWTAMRSDSLPTPCSAICAATSAGRGFTLSTWSAWLNLGRSGPPT